MGSDERNWANRGTPCNGPRLSITPCLLTGCLKETIPPGLSLEQARFDTPGTISIPGYPGTLSGDSIFYPGTVLSGDSI